MPTKRTISLTIETDADNDTVERAFGTFLWAIGGRVVDPPVRVVRHFVRDAPEKDQQLGDEPVNPKSDDVVR
jgi:hypothetical protein